MPPLVPISPIRLLFISFDLPNSKPGDARYRDVDRYLAGLGSLVRPLKQTRLLVTTHSEGAVLAGIRARIGMRGGVFVARVSRASRFFSWDTAIRAMIRQAIRRFGSR